MQEIAIVILYIYLSGIPPLMCCCNVSRTVWKTNPWTSGPNRSRLIGSVLYTKWPPEVLNKAICFYPQIIYIHSRYQRTGYQLTSKVCSVYWKGTAGCVVKADLIHFFTLVCDIWIRILAAQKQWGNKMKSRGVPHLLFLYMKYTVMENSDMEMTCKV